MIISQKPLEENVQERIIHFASQDKSAFFNGFQMVDKSKMDKFIEDMQKAKSYFIIK